MHSWKTKLISLLLAPILCGAPEVANAAQQSQQAPLPESAQTRETEPQTTSPAPLALAPSPAAAESNTSAPVQETVEPLPDAPSAQDQTSNRSEPSLNQNQAPENEPAGTAAARGGILKGGPASKPAGAAIAPSKQRRVRSILIKLGAIAGTGAALGTVFALSKASPSRPPGAH